MKILLCLSKTGGGHHSAANAIRNAITERCMANNPVEANCQIIIDDVVEGSNPLHNLFVVLYNLLLRYHQSWMKYYYAIIEFFKPNNSAFGYWMASGYVKGLLRRVQPSIVVSVHPMANHYLSRALRELKLANKPKLIVVVTDPNAEIWSGWACDDADLTIAANDLVKQRLIELGVRAERILILGMPVDPEFLHPALINRHQFLNGLGLNPKLITICITAGWAGGGNTIAIYTALSEVRKVIQVIVVCGNNELLFKEVKEKSSSMNFQTAVLRELPSLSDAMNACDLLVTKAGGLTTYEAVARQIPMAIDMLTEAMPQESGTAELLIDAGLAKAIKQSSDIVGIVNALEHVENRSLKSITSKYNLNKIDAVYKMADIIFSNCTKEPIN
ncbi:MAG: hypothetical protein K2X81_23755 [Candidatus Obscuribacterales bacterium]|nr:hypothetical protein [Candidatus Obscuribacterales bacterium]